MHTNTNINLQLQTAKHGFELTNLKERAYGKAFKHARNLNLAVSIVRPATQFSTAQQNDIANYMLDGRKPTSLNGTASQQLGQFKDIVGAAQAGLKAGGVPIQQKTLDATSNTLHELSEAVKYEVPAGQNYKVIGNTDAR